MKNVLKISAVLSRINLVVWGIIVLAALLMSLVMKNAAALVAAFLLSVIVLHSYAALQLHKSIRDPTVPLNSQTPIGIRFIGFIASFFGILYLTEGLALLQNTKEVLDLMQSQMPQFKSLTIRGARIAGLVALLCGLSISVNVFLNFRLLRWWHFRQDSQPKS